MEIAEAFNHATLGDGVLFTGAGFSYGAKNSRPAPNNTVPTAREFSSLLSNKLGSTREYDLPIASQAFKRKFGEHRLISELLSCFSIAEVAEHHKTLAKIPWMRVYTTNYDDCIEVAGRGVGNEWTPVTIDASPTADMNQCVHINGHISNLNLATIQSQLKLTHSSYSSDSFADSKWSTQFRQDMNVARCIAFVGYSLYDLDIARILFSSPDLKERTFFITSPNSDEITVAPLADYGTILPIGVEELARIAKSTKPPLVPITHMFSWLTPFPERVDPQEPSGKEGIDLITLGIAKQAAIAWELAEQKARYAIRRSIVDEILAEIGKGRRWFLIHSDLGNGKTTLIQQLGLLISRLNTTVFFDSAFDLNCIKDIKAIAKKPERVAIFVDQTPDRLNLIDKLLRLNLPNIILFICVRTTQYELGQALYEESLPDHHIPIDINRLSPDDVIVLSSLFDNLGLWGDRAGQTPSEKRRFISQECDSRLSRVIISIFENSEVGRTLVTSAKRVGQDKSRISALVIASFIVSRLGHVPTATLLSEIINDDAWIIIRTDEFRDVAEIIRFQEGAISSRSPIIASYLLRNAFLAEVLLWHIERFVRRLADITRNNSFHHIFTELQRFPIIESIITSNRKRELIIGYFQSISDISYCKKNGLFWLHYAMARLSFGEFKEANIYFAQARSLAKGNHKILTDLNNQYARLLLDSRMKSEDYSDYFEAFEMAHDILIKQINTGENKHFPFRQAKKYVEFVSFRKKNLNQSQLATFATNCRQILSSIENLTGPISRSSEVNECRDAMTRAISIALQ